MDPNLVYLILMVLFPGLFMLGMLLPGLAHRLFTQPRNRAGPFLVPHPACIVTSLAAGALGAWCFFHLNREMAFRSGVGSGFAILVGIWLSSRAIRPARGYLWFCSLPFAVGIWAVCGAIMLTR